MASPTLLLGSLHGRSEGPPGRSLVEGTRDNDSKRQRLDPADLDRKKSLGILTFDTATAGTTRLPTCPAYAKKKGAKFPERLCMKFMTKGYACASPDCKFPHVSNVNSLPDGDKSKLVEFVRKTPGLTWVEGKASAGTT
jgi:hypothetical protein